MNIISHFFSACLGTKVGHITTIIHKDIFPAQKNIKPRQRGGKGRKKGGNKKRGN